MVVHGGVGGIYMVVHIHTDGSLATGPDPPTDVFINIPLCPAIVIKMIIIVIILIIIAIIIIIRPPMAPLIFICTVIKPQESGVRGNPPLLTMLSVSLFFSKWLKNIDFDCIINVKINNMNSTITTPECSVC